MKIQRLTEENRPRVYALLRLAFAESEYEAKVVENLHKNGKTVHEWVSVHRNKIISYIAFTLAYQGKNVCGLHLAPLAVTPEFQNQGVGAELLRFALRQDEIKSSPLFVLGEPSYYQKFGFAPCPQPICPFDQNNTHFLSLRHESSTPFTVGYEAEFMSAGKPSRPKGKKRR
jgi:putative acetyltransferase